MKKGNLLVATALVLGLSACVFEKKAVDVVKMDNDTTIVQGNGTIPANATAICRDGSYSTATDHSVCAGKGGVETQIDRYRVE